MSGVDHRFIARPINAGPTDDNGFAGTVWVEGNAAAYRRFLARKGTVLQFTRRSSNVYAVVVKF